MPASDSSPAQRIPGVILAGGRSRRMGGGDKAIRAVAGRSILRRVAARLGSQCGPLAINANGVSARFAELGLAMIADDIDGNIGPLAGLLAAMEWAATLGSDRVATMPADCPFLPEDVVTRLHRAAVDADAAIAVAASGGHVHHIVGLWQTGLRGDLREAIVRDGVRRVGEWTRRYAVAIAQWPVAPFDPFLNVNTPDDLRFAEEVAQMHRL